MKVNMCSATVHIYL